MSEGAGYNPYRDEDGKFASGPGGGGAKKDLKGPSPQHHAERAEHYANKAKKAMEAAHAAKTLNEAKAHELVAAQAAKKAASHAALAEKKGGADNRHAQSAKISAAQAKAHASGSAMNEHASLTPSQKQAKLEAGVDKIALANEHAAKMAGNDIDEMDLAKKSSSPGYHNSALAKSIAQAKSEKTIAHNDAGSHNANRAAHYAQKVQASLEKAKNAKTDLERKTHELAAAAAMKKVQSHAKLAEKKAGPTGASAQAAKQSLAKAQSAHEAHTGQSHEPTKPSAPVKFDMSSTSKHEKMSESELSAFRHQTKANWTPKEKDAIADYSGSGYATLNSALRKGHSLDELKKYGHDTSVVHLDSAIAKSSMPKNTIVYRGAGGKDVFASKKIGDTFSDAGYGSVSTNENVAKTFTKGVRFNISVPAGHPALPVVGFHDHESEIMLPRNTRYKITKTENDKYGTLIVHAEVLPHQHKDL